VAGGIVCAYALLGGRVTLRQALAATLLFAALLAGIELASGMVTIYVTDIAKLIAMNSGTLLPRLLQASSLNFGIVATTLALAALLLWLDRGTFFSAGAARL